MDILVGWVGLHETGVVRFDRGNRRLNYLGVQSFRGKAYGCIQVRLEWILRLVEIIIEGVSCFKVLFSRRCMWWRLVDRSRFLVPVIGSSLSLFVGCSYNSPVLQTKG